MEGMILNQLIELGLTNGEARVYLALIKLGQSTVGPIVKHSKVAYSNIYEILSRLIEKGFVTYIIKSKVKYFQATKLSSLEDYLSKKEQEIFLQRRSLKETMLKLEEIQQTKTDSEAEVFIGLKGLRSAYEKLFSNKTKKHENLFFYIYQEEFKEKSDTFYLNLQNTLTRYIPTRGIVNKEYKNSEFIKNIKFNIRFVDFPIPGNIDIYQDKVLIISWKSPIMGVFIQSEQISENLKNYFEGIWKVSKK